MKYLITYELNNKSKDYSSLLNQIKSSGTKWWHYIESTWVVDSTKTASEIANDLIPYIDQSVDYLLVIKIDDLNKQGWLPKRAWDWLNDLPLDSS